MKDYIKEKGASCPGSIQVQQAVTQADPVLAHMAIKGDCHCILSSDLDFHAMVGPGCLFMYRQKELAIEVE